MRLCTSSQMREIDRHAIEVLGIPGEALMSEAASHVAEAAMGCLAAGGQAAVFCGPGNNGGDGIGAAAVLREKGVGVRVFLIGDRERITPDSKKMLRRLEALGGALEPFVENAGTRDYLSRCGVVIDAVFGTGLNSSLRGGALAAVRMVNGASAKARVVAADIPTGVCADTGAILGEAVKADITVTFSMAKPGHFAEPGCVCCGDVRVRGIGVPEDVLGSVKSNVHAVTLGDVSLPRRNPLSHKGDYGRCLVVGGSVGYTGAPVLGARAASKMGAGLVYLGVPEQIYGIAAAKVDVEMPFPLPGGKDGRLSANAGGPVVRRNAECDVCLFGPGLGVSEAITEIAFSLMRLSKCPLVLDADGLNAIANIRRSSDMAQCPLVLTPHPGEFKKLTGNLFNGDDRIRQARIFATENNCHLVLKGHRTMTALPDGSVHINTTGGPAMAKGGSGDVLAGMIAALIGQRLPIGEAAVTAVYLHGLAGDICAKRLGEYSVTATDIIEALPEAVGAIAQPTV